MLGIGVVGWIATVLWELHVKEPVIDFRLLTNRNFAIASVLFFVFGIGLFGTTTLIPQMLQSLYGYRAIDAGLVLGPGALSSRSSRPSPLSSFSAEIVPPKTAHRQPALIIGLRHVRTTARSTWRRTAATTLWARALQGLGYGFFFVPVNVIAYSQLRPDQNNKASSLTNLFRNWGGSFGIAFITTVSERRQNFHQVQLGANIAPSSASLHDNVHAIANYLVQKGYAHADSLSAAYGVIYQQLQHQAALLAFMDCFRVIGWLTIATVPLLFLVKKFGTAGKVPEGGH